MTEEMKQWRCKHGHLLGLVTRNGSGLRQLLLLRHAVDQEGSADVDVMAVVSGTVMEIRCDICNDMRTWYQGDEDLRLLIERVTQPAEIDS